MTTQTVANNPLGSYPVLVEKTASGENCQSVGLDFGVVSGNVLTPSRVSALNPLPVTGVITGTSDVNVVTEKTATGTITANGQTVVIGPLTGCGAVTLVVSGTYASVNLTFECSNDNSNWTTIGMHRLDTPSFATTTGSISNTIRFYRTETLGIQYIRVRATAYTSGTMNVAFHGVIGSVPNIVETIPTGTQTITGTVTANPVLTTGAGATTNYKNLDLKATTGVNIKNAKTFISEMYAYNNTGATVYVKIYSKATAPTSADTPQLVYGVKAGEGGALLGGQGMELALGFGARCTTGVADADNTDPAANGCVFSACYV